MARIAFHLRHPVANRLGRRLELLREIVGTTPCAHQLHHSAPVFRRIPCMTLGHRGSPSLSPLRHCPPNRVSSNTSPIIFPIFQFEGTFRIALMKATNMRSFFISRFPISPAHLLQSLLTAWNFPMNPYGSISSRTEMNGTRRA